MNNMVIKKSFSDCELNNCGSFNSFHNTNILNMLHNSVLNDIKQIFVSNISQEQIKTFAQVCKNWNEKIIYLIALNQKNKIADIISLKPFSLISNSADKILKATSLIQIEFISKKIRDKIIFKMDDSKSDFFKKNNNLPLYFDIKNICWKEIVDLSSSWDKQKFNEISENLIKINESDLCIKIANKQWAKLNESLSLSDELSDELINDENNNNNLISEKTASAIKADWILNKNFDRVLKLINLIKNAELKEKVIAHLISDILNSDDKDEDVKLLPFLLRLGDAFDWDEEEVINLLIKYNYFDELILYMDSLEYSENDVIAILHSKGYFDSSISYINSLKIDNKLKIEKLLIVVKENILKHKNLLYSTNNINTTLNEIIELIKEYSVGNKKDYFDNIINLIKLIQKEWSISESEEAKFLIKEVENELENLITPTVIIIDSLPDISYSDFNLDSILLDLFSEDLKQKIEQLDMMIESIEQYSMNIVYFPKLFKYIVQTNNTLIKKGYSRTIKFDLY